MNNIESNELIRNKLTEIISKFPVDNRRIDGMPNPSNVRTVHALVNFALLRIKECYGELSTLKGTQVIECCLQGDITKGFTGWQGVMKDKYPDANTSINSLRNGMKLIESMGGFVWKSQGRHRRAKLYCDVETLLLIEQACMILLSPDLEPEKGEMTGDEQLSDDYWGSREAPTNPLRITLKWLGFAAKKVFGFLPRSLELVWDVCEDAIALWDKLHKITVPDPVPKLPECEIVDSFVSDYWLCLGDV